MVAQARTLWYARAVLSGSPHELSPVAKAYRAAAPWLNAVWRFIGPVGLGVFGGYEVDVRFSTKPWGMLGGSLLGLVFGFTAFLMTTSKLLEKKK